MVQSPNHAERKFTERAFLLIGLVAGSVVGASIVSWKGEALATWVERRLAHIASHFGHKAGLRIQEFREG